MSRAPDAVSLTGPQLHEAKRTMRNAVIAARDALPVAARAAASAAIAAEAASRAAMGSASRAAITELRIVRLASCSCGPVSEATSGARDMAKS